MPTSRRSLRTVGPSACKYPNVKFSETVARLNGVNTPTSGLSWTPPTVDVTVARRAIAFVETRRVLFSTYTNEVTGECVQSVLQIRDFLTEVIGNGGIAGELVGPIRLMRRYCVRFLDRVGVTEPQSRISRFSKLGIL